MKFELRGRPQVSFGLTKDEIDVLLKLSARHYDSKCRSVGQPGTGGFLWGWKCHLEFDPKSTVDANFSDLDLCSKLLEEFNVAPLADNEQKTARTLGDCFSQALRAVPSLTEDWSAEIVVGPAHGAKPAREVRAGRPGCDIEAALGRVNGLELAIVQADKDLDTATGFGLVDHMSPGPSKDLLKEVVDAAADAPAPPRPASTAA